MAEMAFRNIARPDEARTFSHGRVEVVKLGDVTFGKATFDPGWKWSEHVRPVVGGASCQVHHNGFIVSGRMGIRMDDGTLHEIGPGDVFVCPPGHDAWTIGDEPCVALDFAAGVASYAKPG
jgi:uncharacterized cupin superfamily protein